MRASTGLLVVACLLVGCGGDDDTTLEEPSADEPAGEPAAEPAGEPAAEPAGDPADEAASEPAGDVNTATVTIGDVTYDFVVPDTIGRCDPDFFGAFWVVATSADGSGGLEMFLVPEGSSNHDETSKVKVNAKDADGRDWRADEDGGEGTPPGESRVESFEVDGSTVTGTASFVDIYAGDGATASGTFSATCP